MPALPQIDDLAKRTLLPSATLNPRSANGADFGSQIGAAVQQTGAAVQDITDQVEQAELMKAKDQKDHRNFQLRTRSLQFAADEQTRAAEMQQNMEPGGFGFQAGFMQEHDVRAEAWLTENGITDENEQAEWRVTLADLRGKLSVNALGTEIGERNRFYVERTGEALDTLASAIDLDPTTFETRRDEGLALIESLAVPPAVKVTLRDSWREAAAVAYGTALGDRDPAALRSALGGPVTEAGDYSGPTAGAAREDFSFFREQGLSSVAAAAVVGVLSWESGGGLAGINPNGRNRGDGNDGSDSIGAGQWNAERADALKAFAAARGKPWSDKDVQLAFVMHELKTSEPEAYRRLQAATTIEQAVEAMSYFERPQGWSNGGDPTAVIHWTERVNRAKHFAGTVAETSQPGSGTVDPRLADLSYTGRRSLTGVAERGIAANVQRDAQAQQQQHQTQVNGLLVGLMDGTRGAEDITNAREAGWLTNFTEIAQANNIVEQRAQQNTAATNFNTAWSTEGFQWNPYDDDQQKAVDAGFAANPTTANMQAIVDRTGMMPSGAVSSLRGQLLSRDPAVVAAAATFANNAMGRNRNIFTAAEGGSDIQDAATRFDYYVNNLNLTAEEAGQRLATDNDPQRPGAVEPNVEVRREFAKTLREQVTAARVIDRLPGGRGAILAQTQSDALMADYTALAEDNFRRYGDAGLARAAAEREINRTYGITASGTFMKYPPEGAYPSVNGSHDYLYRQAAARVEANTDHTVRPEDTFLMPIPTVTAEAWRQGQRPSYQLWYVVEVDGQRRAEVVPGAWRFNVPEGQVAAAGAQRTAQNEQGFNDRRTRNRTQREGLAVTGGAMVP